jgi:AraC-like DNA-binding protein
MGSHSASVREPGLRPESGSPSATDVRVGPLAPLASLLRDLGQDPAPVFGAFDLASDAFDDAERRLPFAVVAGVVQRAATLSRREDIGLLLGQRFQIDQFGLLGALMARAHTVGEALNDLYRFFHLQDRGGAAYLGRRGPSEVALGYSILGQPGPGLAVIHDLVIAIGMRLLRALSGRGFRAQEVFLQRSPPRAVAGYERFFAAPLRFDAPHSEIRFDAQWLEAPVAGGDASRHALAQQAALQAEAAVAQGIVERARAVAQVLLSGGTVSAPQLAAALGLHERTLRRRLAQQGARLQDLMFAARYQLACQMLQDTQLPLGAIAMALGYADAPAFVRAFRGWAGITPGAWRAGANPAR